MDLTTFGLSDPGRVRPGNEDRYVIDVEKRLFAVSDGMGGHRAGEIASRLAVETLTESWGKRVGGFAGLSGAELSKALSDAAQSAMLEVCTAVHAEATAKADHAGMGATLTFVAVEGELAVMGHVGDTRLYLIRDGEAHQLSTDHTLAAELVESGVLDAETARKSSHAGVLTRSLGSQRAVQVDRLVFEVDPGDRLVLCSDGLTGYIPSLGWLAEGATSSTADEHTQRLVAHANESGGKDNVTVVVIDIPKEHERTDSDARGRLQALSSVSFLSDLGLPHRARLAEVAQLRRLEPGEVLVNPDEAWSCLLVVREGSLKVTRDGQNLGQLAAGSCAGFRHVVSPGPATFGLEATEATDVVLLDHDEFLNELHLRTWLGAHVLENLAAELARGAAPDAEAIKDRVMLLP